MRGGVNGDDTERSQEERGSGEKTENVLCVKKYANEVTRRKNNEAGKTVKKKGEVKMLMRENKNE